MNRGLYAGLSEQPDREELYYDGTGNLAIGYLALNAVTEQYGTTAAQSGANNIAIGDYAGAVTPNVAQSVIIGYQAANTGAGNQSVYLGAQVVGDTTAGNTVVGYSATGTGTNATAVGNTANASGSDTTAIGENSYAGASSATAIGAGSSATASNSTAVGYLAVANTGTGVTSLGHSATASAANATALGSSTSATGTSSTALGTGATTSTAHEIALGTSSETVHFFGGLKGTSKSVTGSATYSMVATDFFVYGPAGAGAIASASFTVTLPAPTAGAIYRIKNVGTGTLTVSHNSAETIDGASTVPLSTQYECVEVQADATGTNWYVVGQAATSIL